MHRAVIAVAAGTAVAMLAVRQRAIRNAIARALTVRARRDARRARRGIARGSVRGVTRERWGRGCARASRGSEVMGAEAIREAIRFIPLRESRGTGVGGARGGGARGDARRVRARDWTRPLARGDVELRR